MPRVSIIMPCLNMAKYIGQCMDSVVYQTMHDIEILVVDAGSTDGTLDILNEYVRKDPRVRVVHSDKKSYGYQMNMGIAMAEGEYIGIVETDDIVQPDMFEVLYAKAVQTAADYVKGTSEGFYQGPGGVEWRFPIIPYPELKVKTECAIISEDTPEVFLYDNFLWNGIYRKEFLQRVKFHETPGAAFQDIGALFQIACSAKKGVYLKHLVYNYRQDNGAASSYNKKGFVYADTEYDYVKNFLSSKSDAWQRIYYIKMVGLTLDRFRFMAGSGEFWDESAAGMESLKYKIQSAVKQKTICEEDFTEADWNELLLLSEDVKLLYEYDIQKYLKKKDALLKLLELAKENKIVIFGCGLLGSFLHMYLLVHGVGSVAAYCDNKVSKPQTFFQGIPVLRPEDAVTRDPEVHYIIANKNHAKEMMEQLLSLGVMEDKIYAYAEGTDIYLLKEESAEGAANCYRQKN